MSDACMAIEGVFVWGSQRCYQVAVATVVVDGETFPVCADHAA